VLDVGVEHYDEMAAAADEGPVEAFSADRADEAFCVGAGNGAAQQSTTVKREDGARDDHRLQWFRGASPETIVYALSEPR
jgi:hypothetical protein